MTKYIIRKNYILLFTNIEYFIILKALNLIGQLTYFKEKKRLLL